MNQRKNRVRNNNQVLFWMGLERTEENIPYDLGQAAIHSASEQLTQISYEAYNLGASSQFVDNHFYNVVPFLKTLPKLNSLYPMITTVNIPYLTQLLQSQETMDIFIQQAVKQIQSVNVTGYNIDFEPDRNDASTKLAPSFATFLNRFSDALHGVGKKLTVCIASWSYFWSWDLITKTRVDKVITMDTYATHSDTFDHFFDKAIKNIPIDKLGLGLMYDPSVNQTELERRIKVIEQAGISEIDVWMFQNTTSMWWNAMFEFLHD